MELNKLTYEAFLLDYQEGNLSAENCERLFEFLKQHPELINDLEDFSLATLKPKSVVLHEKSFLKKKDSRSVDLEYFDELCVKSIENELNNAESIYFNRLINESNELKERFDSFSKTIFQKSDPILFPNKELLYKKEEKERTVFFRIIKSRVVRYGSVAAAFIILFFNFFDHTSTIDSLPEPINNDLVDINPYIETKIPEKADQKGSVPVALTQNNSNEITSVVSKDIKTNVESIFTNEKTEVIGENKNIIEDELISVTITENSDEQTMDVQHPESITENSKDNITLASIDHNSETIKSNKGTVWGFVKRIVEGVTGRKVKVKYKENNEGDVYAYSIEDDKFSIKHVKSRN